MCRYCKNLKRLKDLDEKEYKKIIDKWRRNDEFARRLLEHSLFYACFYYLFFAGDACANKYLAEVRHFLLKNFIGSEVME